MIDFLRTFIQWFTIGLLVIVLVGVLIFAWTTQPWYVGAIVTFFVLLFVANIMIAEL